MDTSTTSKKLLIAKTLMWVAAVAALGAGISAITNVMDAGVDTKIVETWRMLGFVTFAALFAFLAWRPAQSRLLWLIVIFNKVALTIAGAYFVTLPDVKGVIDVLVFDGGLSVLLIVAFVLSHPFSAKKPLGEEE